MAVVTGRIINDAVSRTTKSGKQLLEFTLIEVYSYTSKQGEDKEIKTFYNCVIWNNVTIAPELTKGKLVSVRGYVEANAYTGRDGAAKASLRVTVKDHEILPDDCLNNKQQPAKATDAAR